MPQGIRSGFLRSTAGALIVTNVLAGARQRSGFLRTPDGALCVVGPNGEALSSSTDLAAAKMQMLRTRDPWRPEGVKAENFSRISPTKNMAGVLTSGTLYVVGGLLLPEGETITNIDFYSATQAGVELTNQWACLLNMERKILGISADKGAEAWGANSKKSFALGGAGYKAPAGEFQPVYAALLVKGTTPPTLRGLEAENTFPGNQAPMAAADSTAGLSGPLVAGEVVGALAAKNRMAFVTVR